MYRRSAPFVIMLVFSSLAGARDVYVNNVAGDDRNPGQAPVTSGAGSGPCRTIARALRAARKGDRIVLANTERPYRESITLEGGRHSGLSGTPFVIEGNGAVLDGSLPIAEEAWEHVRGDVFRFRPPRMGNQLLFLHDVPAERAPDAGPGGQLPELRPLQWRPADRYLYFRVEKDKLPRDYPLTHTGLAVGITLYEVRNVVISNLVVQGFQLDGINAHDNVFDCRLVEVTCRGNARSGISVGGASRVKIERCLVGNNGRAQLRTEGYSKTEVVDSELLDNTAPPWVIEGGRLVVDGKAINRQSD